MVPQLSKTDPLRRRRDVPDELKGRRRGVLPHGFRGVVGSGSANKENVPPPPTARYPNPRGHHCSIDDDLTDDGEQVGVHNVSFPYLK